MRFMLLTQLNNEGANEMINKKHRVQCKRCTWKGQRVKLNQPCPRCGSMCPEIDPTTKNDRGCISEKQVCTRAQNALNNAGYKWPKTGMEKTIIRLALEDGSLDLSNMRNCGKHSIKLIHETVGFKPAPKRRTPKRSYKCPCCALIGTHSEFYIG